MFPYSSTNFLCVISIILCIIGIMLLLLYYSINKKQITEMEIIQMLKGERERVRLLKFMKEKEKDQEKKRKRVMNKIIKPKKLSLKERIDFFVLMCKGRN